MHEFNFSSFCGNEIRSNVIIEYPKTMGSFMTRRFITTLTIMLCLFSPVSQASIRHPLDGHLTDNYTGDLNELLERKYIRVLTTYNRTNFFLANGRLRGFEYALVQRYQKALNKNIPKKELQVVFEFIPVSRDRLISGLIEGYGDIAAAGLTVTAERKQKVDFTTAYLSGIDEVLVTYKTVPAVSTPSALAGKSLYIRKSSSYYESVMALNRRLREQGKRPVQILRADENLETEDILELVNIGAISQTVCDSHMADAWAEVLPDIRVNHNVRFRQGGKIAWAIRKHSPKLKESLDRFIRSHRKGTLLGNIYFNRYFENTSWIKNPLDGGAEKRLATYAPLFKTYGEQYGFDWRLIAAMAYQESGFNNNKVSPRGAVGIMQIRPATAADPNVGITDIRNLENNINAGTKYLSFLQSRYFDDAKIPLQDQVRFSLAAYNAGPVKIRRGRNMAKDMGLDPNRWFRNVEIAMLEVVGQETVRYVSNINKYYVVYKNAFERVEKRKEAILDAERK